MDEAYVQFAKNPESLTMVPAIANRKNIIVAQTFSKLYGLAGIRVGYAVSTPEIISYLQRESIVRSLNVVGIRGAFAAMDDLEFAKKTIENNAAGREYLTEELTKLGYRVYPSESNFVYVDMGADPKEITNKLLPYGIITRDNFPCLRISIGTAAQNTRVMDIIKEIASSGN
jgi:histidinol-phosphate aminotransferase